MASKKNKSLLELLGEFEQIEDTTFYEGFLSTDKNFDNRILLIESSKQFYSFGDEDIVSKVEIGNNKFRIFVRNGVIGYSTSSFLTGVNIANIPFQVGMEDIAPPPPDYDKDAPTLVIEEELKDYDDDFSIMSLSSAFRSYNGRCVGGDSFPNNCAHFLSDAFIRAGYRELLPNNPHINARCSPAKRPIRARDMWSWFRSKARRTSRTVRRNTGMWAVFQLNESQYWGGHVVLLDSNAWKYQGTGWYGNWNQYLYQW